MTGIKNAFSSADDVWKAQYQACMHIFYSSYILERHENCYYLQKAATNTFSKTSYVPHPLSQSRGGLPLETRTPLYTACTSILAVA